MGCNGGYFTYVYNYAKTTAIANSTIYPYTASASSCKASASNRGLYKVSSYSASTYNSCPSLLAQLQKGPVAVAVDASYWYLYGSGIMSISSCPNTGTINHGVLLVGVDQCNNWKIQNSWGASWGEKGFIRLAAGSTCSVCLYGGYSVSLA